MQKLSIDKRCVDCGNCEAWLPGIMAHRYKGELLISKRNESVDYDAIRMAIDSCPLGYLKLEEI